LRVREERAASGTGELFLARAEGRALEVDRTNAGLRLGLPLEPPAFAITFDAGTPSVRSAF
jgi:hypothetical protein